MVDRSKSLRNYLVKSGLLNDDQVKEAIEEGSRTGETLIKSLLRKGIIDEASLIKFLEKEMDVPRVDLASYLVDQKIVGLVPVAMAKKYKVMPLFKVGDVLTVAMVDPFDVVALDDIRAKSKCDVEPMVSTSKEIEQAIIQYYELSGSVDDLVKSIGPNVKSVTAVSPALLEEAPVMKLVNTLIVRAFSEKASDIHIEPTAKDIRIRYRVDGIMHD